VLGIIFIVKGALALIFVFKEQCNLIKICFLPVNLLINMVSIYC